jgi:hypothetical protein
VQFEFVACTQAEHGLFDFGEQIFAAHHELNRVGQFVEDFAQRVFQSPGQRDHARGCDFHARIVAVCTCTYHGLMQTQQPLAMLGGLTASDFMQRYWQKKPLLVRQAFPQFKPLLSRKQLFELAANPDVGSRLVQGRGRDWQMRHGPFNARKRPPFAQAHWTLLVQGVDLHSHDARARAAAKFPLCARRPPGRFDGQSMGQPMAVGWGRTFDSYDVFLMQAQRSADAGAISAQKDLSFAAGHAA